MFVIVDSNEGTDRDKKENIEREERGEARKDQSNIRMINRLKKYFPKLQQGPLTCGDINVILDGEGGVLAIERKRAGDFLGSIGSRRIFKQVENMANNANWPCIIVEGVISYDKDDMAVIPTFDRFDHVNGYEVTGWPGASIRGAMYAIEWSGCPIITIEPSSLPNMIVDLARFCSKPAEHVQMLDRKRYVTFPPIEFSEGLIATFPSIGLKRTRSLKEFSRSNNDTGTPTLAEMLCWGSNLGKIHKKSRPEGWGDMMVTNFRAALGLQEGEYLMVVRDEEEQSNNGNKKGKKNGK
jgi:hypothetical protein